MFLLGIMMLVTGIDELQKGRKEYGWLSIIVFLFCIFVSFKGMISN
ncbi:YczI family protein [Bacillus sp. DNRA2]